MEEGVGIEVLKASGLAEAQELLVNEGIINGVELVDVVDHVLGVFLNTMLHQGLTALAPAGHGGGVRSRGEGGERARKQGKGRVVADTGQARLSRLCCCAFPAPASATNVLAHSRPPSPLRPLLLYRQVQIYENGMTQMSKQAFVGLSRLRYAAAACAAVEVVGCVEALGVGAWLGCDGRLEVHVHAW